MNEFITSHRPSCLKLGSFLKAVNSPVELTADEKALIEAAESSWQEHQTKIMAHSPDAAVAELRRRKELVHTGGSDEAIAELSADTRNDLLMKFKTTRHALKVSQDRVLRKCAVPLAIICERAADQAESIAISVQTVERDFAQAAGIDYAPSSGIREILARVAALRAHAAELRSGVFSASSETSRPSYTVALVM